MQEIWKLIAEDTRYEVSNFGRVRSYCRRNGPHILKAGIASNGYPTVCLGQGNTRCVHVLVAEAFLGPKPFESAEVLHKNGERTDPIFCNLEWGTRSKNNRDRKWTGGHIKLTGLQAREIKQRLVDGDLGVDIAGDFGVAVTTISAIKCGKFHTDA